MDVLCGLGTSAHKIIIINSESKYYHNVNIRVYPKLTFQKHRKPLNNSLTIIIIEINADFDSGKKQQLFLLRRILLCSRILK